MRHIISQYLLVVCVLVLAAGCANKLYNASFYGDNIAVSTLLAEGVDVNSEGFYGGATSLMAASQNGHIDIVRILLANGANVDAQRDEGQTALIYATVHPDIVKLLLDAGAETELKSILGHTALLYASTEGNTETVKALIEGGADIDVKDVALDFTPLIYASMNGHTDIVKALIDAGADINVKSKKLNITALSIAIHNNHAETVYFLRKAGATK